MQSKDLNLIEKTRLTEKKKWEKVVSEKMIDWKIDSRLHAPIIYTIENFTPMMFILIIGFLIRLNKSRN